MKIKHKVGDILLSPEWGLGMITKIEENDPTINNPDYKMIYCIEYFNGKTGRNSSVTVDSMKDELKYLQIKHKKENQSA